MTTVQIFTLISYWLFCIGYMFASARKPQFFAFIASAIVGMIFVPMMLAVDLQTFLNEK